MSDRSELQQSLSWILSGAAAALGVAVTAGQRAHEHIWFSFVASRPSFDVAQAMAGPLSVTMRNLWGMAIVALIFGAAALLLARPGTRARWMAVASLVSACSGVWLLRAYEHHVKWS